MARNAEIHQKRATYRIKNHSVLKPHQKIEESLVVSEAKKQTKDETGDKGYMRKEGSEHV